MEIRDYTITDLMFAHWFKRKRELLAEHAAIPSWLDNELDKLRPRRNPHCSVFVLDDGPLRSTRPPHAATRTTKTHEHD